MKKATLAGRIRDWIKERSVRLSVGRLKTPEHEDLKGNAQGGKEYTGFKISGKW